MPDPDSTRMSDHTTILPELPTRDQPIPHIYLPARPRWMRAYNDGRPGSARLRFAGFHRPLEITGGASGRQAGALVRALMDSDVMRILIVTAGSRGDVAPFTDMGQRLQEAGHPRTSTSLVRAWPRP
jgi:hypothetical protein